MPDLHPTIGPEWSSAVSYSWLLLPLCLAQGEERLAYLVLLIRLRVCTIPAREVSANARYKRVLPHGVATPGTRQGETGSPQLCPQLADLARHISSNYTLHNA